MILQNPTWTSHQKERWFDKQTMQSLSQEHFEYSEKQERPRKISTAMNQITDFPKKKTDFPM